MQLKTNPTQSLKIVETKYVKFELTLGSKEVQVSVSLELEAISGVMVRPVMSQAKPGMVDPNAGNVGVVVVTKEGSEIGICQCTNIEEGEKVAEKLREVVHPGYPDGSKTIRL